MRCQKISFDIFWYRCKTCQTNVKTCEDNDVKGSVLLVRPTNKHLQEHCLFSSSCNWPTLTDVDYNPSNVQHCTTVHKGMKDCDQWQPVALPARGWMGFPPSCPSFVFFCASNRGCTIPFFPHLLTKFSSCCFTQVTAKAFQSKWSKFVWGPSLGWGLPTFDSVLSTFSSSGDSLLLHLNICQQAALKCSHWATRMACHTVQKLTFYRDGITTKLQ